MTPTMKLAILSAAILAALPAIVLAEAHVVENPAAPAQGRHTVQLEELWRIGGDSDDEGEFFGVIATITAGQNGDLYLLDTQLSEVKVFSAAGEYLRTIGREGEGPGEFRRPSDLAVFADGKVGVLQPRPPALVLLTPEGEPVGNHPLPVANERGSMIFGMGNGAGNLVLVGAQMKFDQNGMERNRRVVSVNSAGEETAEFYSSVTKMDMATMAIREQDTLGELISVGDDGRLSASMEYDYSIDVWNADGTLDHTITREFEPYLRSKDELEDMRQQMKNRIRFRGPRQPAFEVADRDRAVRWMERNTDGTLWVLNAREVRQAKDDVLGVFDVFDADGNFTRQMELLGDGSFDDDRFVLIGERLYVITQFESAMAAMRGGSEEEDEDADLIPMEVICYQIGEAPGR